MKVICLKPVYADNRGLGPLDVYKVGHIYTASYLFERVLMAENDIMEYEWIVYCGPHNHYQFTDKEFNEYFKDVEKDRDEKIKIIIN